MQRSGIDKAHFLDISVSITYDKVSSRIYGNWDDSHFEVVNLIHLIEMLCIYFAAYLFRDSMF